MRKFKQLLVATLLLLFSYPASALSKQEALEQCPVAVTWATQNVFTAYHNQKPLGVALHELDWIDSINKASPAMHAAKVKLIRAVYGYIDSPTEKEKNHLLDIMDALLGVCVEDFSKSDSISI